MQASQPLDDGLDLVANLDEVLRHGLTIHGIELTTAEPIFIETPLSDLDQISSLLERGFPVERERPEVVRRQSGFDLAVLRLQHEQGVGVEPIAKAGVVAEIGHIHVGHVTNLRPTLLDASSLV